MRLLLTAVAPVVIAQNLARLQRDAVVEPSRALDERLTGVIVAREQASAQRQGDDRVVGRAIVQGAQLRKRCVGIGADFLC